MTPRVAAAAKACMDTVAVRSLILRRAFSERWSWISFCAHWGSREMSREPSPCAGDW
ncbi:hypothetical protein ACFQVD_05005 [Streptosporangium amethystogenes subsp. fukuiense]|uniref:Uncharacterized protein n=1 Tax=Streptosporangium amethystogenes subsp. fukuiense TaxID=698418 RepID=A0ABW2STS8_9ACTN